MTVPSRFTNFLKRFSQMEKYHRTHTFSSLCLRLFQYPTKAICPILLEDFRKITVERKGETNFFTSQMIKDCMKKGTLGITLFIFFTLEMAFL
jgi:hypothetical protein